MMQHFMCRRAVIRPIEEDRSNASDVVVVARRAVFVANLERKRQIVCNPWVALQQPANKRGAFWGEATVALGAIDNLHGALKATDARASSLGLIAGDTAVYVPT